MAKRLKLAPGKTWRQYAKARINFFIRLSQMQHGDSVVIDLKDLKRWARCMRVNAR